MIFLQRCGLRRSSNVKLTLEHVTEGHLIVDELKDEPVPMAVGPSLTMPASLSCATKPLKRREFWRLRLSGIDHHGFSSHSAAVSAAVAGLAIKSE
ncbi:MAG: hypothetical protein ACLSA6_06420 [Holdemania massiliensis]